MIGFLGGLFVLLLIGAGMLTVYCMSNGSTEQGSISLHRVDEDDDKRS